MGVRSKMLAIAAWRLFLLLPTVVGQSPNVTNPLVPENFTTNVKVKLTYRTAADKVGPVCGQYIDVQGSSTVIDLPAPDIERKASQVRTAPQVQFTGLDTTKLYTYLVVDQSIIIPMYGSRERPFVQELRVNVRGGDINTGVVVAPHHPVVPENITSGIHVLVYSQPAEFTNPDISDYVNTECGLGLRCDFDVLQFAMNNSLNLVFAGGLRVQEDEFSIAAIAAFNEQVACHKLWRFRAAKNPLIGDADLMIGMKAVFKTKEVVTEPLCARVFHYMDDEVYVKWNSTKAFPSRKVRALPHVYLRPMMEQTNTEGGNMEGDKMGGDKMDGDKMGGDKMEGDKMGGDKMDGDKMGGDKMGESDKPSNKSAEKKDHWFTLLLVDQTITDTNSREEPFANWVVSNIKNTDLGSGDCSVPYFPVLAPHGVAQATFLLYKQSKHIEIDPSEYAKDTPCHYQFRCNWDIRRLVKDKGLKLVGALPFQVKADPVSITHWVKEEMLKPEEGCRELAKFNHEGRMLGECLPKFDAWKALKKELDECVMEFQKKMIMEKMKNMCPELGEHFSKEMKKWGDEKKGGEMGGAMQEYGKMKDMGGKDDMKSMMDDMKKEDMEMLIKKFLMDAMDKMDKMKEAKEGDVMKPDEDMKGPHCIQVVTKYMMMMKKKMMEGDDKMDDEGDMNMEEGCKCLKAAKMFMKEHWEKYQAKKEAEKDWEKWRSWGGKGEMKDKEDEKAEWDKMMKEMWSKWEEKKDEKDDWGKGEDDDKVKKMMEELKTKMMKEFWDKMKGGEKGGDKDWESKWDSWKNWGKEEKKGEEEDKLKKMMEEMKAKMMKEFWDKMKGGEKGGDKDWESKWNTWKNWGKDEKKDGEGDKMKMMMEMMMKMKMMKEMMEKMKKGGDMMNKEGEKDWDAKWESWKNWGKDEKKDREGDKMKMMMEMMMKMKMMKEMMEKMKKGGDMMDKEGEKDWDAKWESWKNWGKDEKKDGEEDKMKMMMEEFKKKMMKEFWDKMSKGGEKDKWEMMMEEIKMKIMKEKKMDGDKDMWGKMMEEMRKKWGEGDGEMSEQEKKEKKMAFLVHAFKAFLTKHMAMKDKLDMVHDIMKKKMALEKMCSEEELKKGPDSKCGMMMKELMMKKKMMEMLKETFMDMQEEKEAKNEEKNALVKKMVAGMMGDMKEM